MAIDKYSGLSQSDKFFARYGKSIGKEAVNRQKLHLASETIKSEARVAAQLPNYAAKTQEPLLRLPKLSGGIYETTIKNVTQKQANEKAVNQVLRAIKRNPGFNWRESDLALKPGVIEAVEAKLEEASAKKAATNATGKAGQKLITSTTTAAGAAADGASKSVKGLLPASVDTGKSTKGLLGGLVDSLKSFAKTKKGKLGIAAAALATVIGGGIYLYNRNKDHNIPVSDSSPINDLAKEPVKGTMSASGPYTVAKGDNIWCIARSHLMEVHKDDKDYKPTDVEILQRTEEIMQLNNLHYEKDCYRVIIQPNQSLKLVA